MGNPSIQEQFSMLYNDYVKFLLDKYGKVQGNYFSTPSCKSKNKKIFRTKEGLNIHHIDEDKSIMLGNPRIASSSPFEYQLADRLVYANLLEHLLLHIKIVEGFNVNEETPEPVGIGGVLMIVHEINDYFGKLPEEPTGWRSNMFNAIRSQYNDYIETLKYILYSDCTLLSMHSLIDLCSGWYSRDIYSNIYSDLLDN